MKKLLHIFGIGAFILLFVGYCRNAITLNQLIKNQLVGGGYSNLQSNSGINISLGIVTSTRSNVVNGSVTSSVSIGNPGVGFVCQWNGTNFTLTRFPANSTTPTYTTSTSCN